MKELREEHQNIWEAILTEKRGMSKKSVGEGYIYSCEPQPHHSHWNNLGPDYYPRTIRSVTCNASDCARYTQCMPIQYPVRVLRKVGANETMSDRQRQDRAMLPAALQVPVPDAYTNQPIQFVFDNITVNVSCACY
jgi:hypothetical protein